MRSSTDLSSLSDLSEKRPGGAAVANSDWVSAIVERIEQAANVARIALKELPASDQHHAVITVLDTMSTMVETLRCGVSSTFEGRGPKSMANDSMGSLTPQEREVVRCMAAGSSNREIACHLFVSVKTVESHLTRIYRKYSAGSRTHLLAILNQE